MTAEFDALADDYAGGCDDKLKTLIGCSQERFLAVKLDLLLRSLDRAGLSANDPDIRFLDFGCGTGDFVNLVAQRSVRWSLEACDVSGGMLREAERRHPKLAGNVGFWDCAESTVPAGSYDLITVICVMHHIQPASWAAKLRELWNGIRPGGSLFVFEHNPRNPVTRFMVWREPIDKNAVLIDHTTMTSHLSRLDSPDVEVTNFLFFPPRVPGLRALEGRLAPLPWGGQYMARATKPRPQQQGTAGPENGISPDG
jgi:SAM-dependent methyltransferase